MATTVVSEYQKITTTGTAVALASAQEVLTLYLYTPRGNRFPVHFGSSTVTATGATTDGLIIPPGRVTPNQGPCDLADSYINGHEKDGVYYRATYGPETITYSSPDNTSVGSATTEIVAANTDRKYLAIINDSDEVIYLAIGADAVMNKGIRINFSGGSFEMTEKNLSLQAVDGICASGTKNVTIQEAE